LKSFGNSCFSEVSVENLTFETEAWPAKIEESCFVKPSPGQIYTPWLAEVLENSGFSDATVESLVSEAESPQMIIEESCFMQCSLQSIFIPKNVTQIDGYVFHESSIGLVSVESGNRQFNVDRDFLVDVVDSIVIRYFGQDGDAFVWKEVKVLGNSCPRVGADR
jgi:hypothetical protein